MRLTKLELLAIALFVFSSAHLHAQFTADIGTAASAFINTLDSDQQKQATFTFRDSARFKWTNLPVGLVSRPGIQYGMLSDKSRIAFHELLNAALSSQGYLKITTIMALDDILNTLYQDAFDKGSIDKELLTRLQGLKWAYENFYISVWGKPDKQEPWGINFGGHHVALSLTIVGKTISVSPLFLGTDPSQVKTGKYAGLRALSKEEDYGFMLVNMLSTEQKKKAILSQAVPKDIITNPTSEQRIDNYYGISAKELNADQRAVLKLIIAEYTHNFEHNTAHRLVDEIEKTGYSKIYFAWIGSTERNKPHYYIINSPDFLIEYDNVGFQDDGNHVHCILREKGNDFGDDLLKAHYLNSGHHKD